MSMTSYEATQYLAGMIEAIQVLHAQARLVADEHNLTFDITLEGGRNYDTQHDYAPTNGWQSSSYNC